LDGSSAFNFNFFGGGGALGRGEVGGGGSTGEGRQWRGFLGFIASSPSFFIQPAHSLIMPKLYFSPYTIILFNLSLKSILLLFLSILTKM